jgi:hypothetical protein
MGAAPAAPAPAPAAEGDGAQPAAAPGLAEAELVTYNDLLVALLKQGARVGDGHYKVFLMDTVRQW